MGRVYTATADLANGETHLTEALRLARVLDLEPTEIVRAINALGESLIWRNKHEAVPSSPMRRSLFSAKNR